jgi:hypothetical protein
MSAGRKLNEASIGVHTGTQLDEGDYDMSWRLLLGALAMAVATAVAALASIAWLAWRL